MTHPVIETAAEAILRCAAHPWPSAPEYVKSLCREEARAAVIAALIELKSPSMALGTEIQFIVHGELALAKWRGCVDAAIQEIEQL